MVRGTPETVRLLPLVKRTAAVCATIAAFLLVAVVLRGAGVALIVIGGALLVATALNRPVAWLERKHVPRAAGIAAVMLAVLAGLAAVALILFPPAIDQVQRLVDEGPALLDKIRATRAWQFVDQHGLANGWRQRADGVAKAALALVASLVGLLAGLVTVLFVVVFMLVSGRELIWSALARARPARREVYGRTLRSVYASLGAYVAGLFAIVIANAALSGTFLAIIGVPYFLPLAVLSGLSSLVPYVGAIIAGSLLTGVAWASGGTTAALATAIYYVVYQQVENHLISPLVYRKAVHLNPLVILLAVLLFTELGGIPGALAAVPAASIAQIVIGEMLRARKQRLDLPDVEPGPHLLDAPH